MAEYDSFEGHIGDTRADSEPWWPDEVVVQSTQPNVVVILFDDLGFAQLGCYGSSISTPAIDGLAADGVRFTGFHVTALCGPSRAALLTGRNHHSVGMGTISQFSSGFPGYHARLPKEAATLATVLRDAGYSTFAVGKWHLAPETEMGAAGPFERWPLAQGFERYYGFLHGKSDHWTPDLVEDNHFIPTPRREGYHLTEDLVDHAISFVRDQHVGAPDRPFFLYLALGAVHSPHHAPSEYIDRYRGAFDEGWDVLRERWFGNQLELGILPEDTTLPPRNPGVPAWSDLGKDEQRYFARQQEVFAGFLEHTDAQIGRLVAYLKELGELDNTIVLLLSDNGAAAEGNASGLVNDERAANGIPDTREEQLASIEDLGGPEHFNLYSTGWATAGNTPLRWYKQTTHGGGVRSPLIVHWPARIADAGTFRRHFAYITDVFPTVLQWLDLQAPRSVAGVAQMPVHGSSFAYAVENSAAVSRRGLQYFEIGGHRGLYLEGWKAVTYHGKGDPFADDVWELFHLDSDFSESRDLAPSEGARLEEMVGLWWDEARRNAVLPLDDRRFEHTRDVRSGSPPRTSFVFLPGAAPLVAANAPDFRNRSFEIVAEVASAAPIASGVLFSAGTRHSGIVLYAREGSLVFTYNYTGRYERITAPPVDLADGAVVRFSFDRTGDLRGDGRIEVNGEIVATGVLTRTLPNRVFLGGAGAGLTSSSAVDPEYEAPFPFAGVIRRVIVTLHDDQVLG